MHEIVKYFILTEIHEQCLNPMPGRLIGPGRPAEPTDRSGNADVAGQRPAQASSSATAAQRITCTACRRGSGIPLAGRPAERRRAPRCRGQESMGCGASMALAGPPSADAATEERTPGMPSTLPPAYVCIYCSDISCRCHCLYCGAVGHSMKLCERRLKHGFEVGSAVDLQPGGAFAPRTHVHVRYSRAIDDQPTQVDPHHAANLMRKHEGEVQGCWRVDRPAPVLRAPWHRQRSAPPPPPPARKRV